MAPRSTFDSHRCTRLRRTCLYCGRTVVIVRATKLCVNKAATSQRRKNARGSCQKILLMSTFFQNTIPATTTTPLHQYNHALVKEVQNCIQQCLTQYMTRTETITFLIQQRHDPFVANLGIFATVFF